MDPQHRHNSSTDRSHGKPAPDSAEWQNASFSSPGTPRGAIEAAFSTAALEGIEQQLIRNFVTQVPGVMQSLITSLNPPLNRNSTFLQVQSEKEYGFRERLLELRNDVYVLLYNAGHICDSLLPLIQREDTEKVSELVWTRVGDFSRDVDGLLIQIESLQLEMYEAAVALKIKNCPSQRAIERQLGRTFESFGHFIAWRDEQLDHDPELHVSAPMKMDRTLASSLRYEPTERAVLDVNYAVVSAMLSGPGASVQANATCPHISAIPADFSMLLSLTQSWLNKTERQASRDALLALSEDNSLFDAITEPGFITSATGRFMQQNFIDKQVPRISVADDGVVTVQMPLPEMVSAAFEDALFAHKNVWSAISELAERNQIRVAVEVGDQDASVSFTPLTVPSEDNDQLNILDHLIGLDELGLAEEGDDGAPFLIADADADEGIAEEPQSMYQTRPVALPRYIQTGDGDRRYQIIVDAPAILTPRAGSRLRMLAESIDRYMELLPAAHIAALHNIHSAPPQVAGATMLVDDRSAQQSAAYEKGKFDFVSFASEQNTGLEPEIWVQKLHAELDEIFAWVTTRESLPGFESAKGDAAPRGNRGSREILLDSDSFHDPAVLQAMERMSAIGHFSHLTLYLEELQRISSTSRDSPITARHLLAETEVVVSAVGAAVQERPLSLTLENVSVPLISRKETVIEVILFEARLPGGDICAQGYLEPESGEILYQLVSAADVKEFSNRIEQVYAAHGSGKSAGPLGGSDLFRALESQNVRIDDPYAAVSLVIAAATTAGQHDVEEVLAQLFKIPGMHVLRDAENTLTLRCLTDDELQRSGGSGPRSS